MNELHNTSIRNGGEGPLPRIMYQRQAEMYWRTADVPVLAQRIRNEGQRQLYEELQQRAQSLVQTVTQRYPTVTNESVRDVAHDQDILHALMILAEGARGLSIQYRNFRVGAAMLAVQRDKSGNLSWRIDLSANVKDRHEIEGGVKFCAETQLLRIARDPAHNITKIVCIVVAGHTKEDDRSKQKTPVLTPCEVCRDALFEECAHEHPLLHSDTPNCMRAEKTYATGC